MTKHSPAHAQVDPLPNRLIAIGCALLVTPCGFLVMAFLWYGWPLLLAPFFP